MKRNLDITHRRLWLLRHAYPDTFSLARLRAVMRYCFHVEALSLSGVASFDVAMAESLPPCCRRFALVGCDEVDPCSLERVSCAPVLADVIRRLLTQA